MMEEKNMNKIKVLMVGSETNVKGGMTTVVNSFLNHTFSECEIRYIPTHYNCGIKKNIIKFFLNITSLTKAIKENDIIHMHMSERGSCVRKYIVFKIAKKNNKKVLLHTHGAEFKEYYSKLSDNRKKRIIELLTGCDKVLTLGESWNKYFKSLNRNIKCSILKNSVEIPPGKVSMDDKTFNILFLAIIDKRKGIYDLIEAANKVLKTYDGNKKINFIIAGIGKEEEQIKGIVKKYNLDNNFEFLGWINSEEKSEVLKKSHLFVLPSYNEGLPVSILEAISYGVPVISTNVGSINEAVLNDFNGYLIEAGDIEALKCRIKDIIENRELWIRFSSNSKELCKQEFNSEEYFKKIEKLYSDLNKN